MGNIPSITCIIRILGRTDADDAGGAGDVAGAKDAKRIRGESNTPTSHSKDLVERVGIGGVTGKEVRSISYVQHAACCRRIQYSGLTQYCSFAKDGGSYLDPPSKVWASWFSSS